MKNKEINTTEISDYPTPQELKGIHIHKIAASHFEAAAKSHLEVANHTEAGNHDLAAKCRTEAISHTNLGQIAQNQDAAQHSIQG